MTIQTHASVVYACLAGVFGMSPSPPGTETARSLYCARRLLRWECSCASTSVSVAQRTSCCSSTHLPCLALARRADSGRVNLFCRSLAVVQTCMQSRGLCVGQYLCLSWSILSSPTSFSLTPVILTTRHPRTVPRP